jgi:peptide/nickel transport system substrate-binding protein
MQRPESLENLVESMIDGRLTRRDLFKRSAAIGLSATAFASLLAACGDDDEDDTPDAPAAQPTPEPADDDDEEEDEDEDDEEEETPEPDDDDDEEETPEPTSGGELILANPSEPFRLDPAIAGSAGEYQISQAIYNNLLRVDRELTPQPELATSFEVADDGLMYTFELRDDVTYHHGKAFGADDVVFTIERILNPETASPGRSLFAVIDEMETPDDYTIIFNLSSTFADFPMIFGTTFGRILPSDRSEEEISRDPVGTGPFKMELYEPGSQVVMMKNEDYWEEGLPRVDRLVQVQIPEQTGQAAALVEGQIHIFWDVGPHVLSTLNASPDVEVVEIPSPSFQPMGLRTSMDPFSNADVRLALKYSVDRTAIVQGVLEGHGTEANDHPVPPISPFWHDTGLKERDLDRARELLASGGYPDGVDVELHTSGERVGLVEQSTIVQAMAEEAGIRININVHPWDIFVAEYNDTAPMFCTNWFGRPTIDETLYPYYHSEGSWNEYDYSNPEVDRLLEAGRAEIDPDQRYEIYAELQELLSEDGPVLVAYHRTYMSAFRRELKGYEPHPIRWVDVRWAYFEDD